MPSPPRMLILVGACSAEAKDGPTAETTAGWVKLPKNPVLGGNLGTCFDVSLLKEGDEYRMWWKSSPSRQ
jgi:hypothetical protein